MTKEDFLIDIAEAGKSGKAVVIVTEGTDENGELSVSTFVASGSTDTKELATGFSQIDWTGRVPVDEVWGEWQRFYDTPEDAEVYGFDLEDGKVQVGIFNMSPGEACSRLK